MRAILVSRARRCMDNGRTPAAQHVADTIDHEYAAKNQRCKTKSVFRYSQYSQRLTPELIVREESVEAFDLENDIQAISAPVE